MPAIASRPEAGPWSGGRRPLPETPCPVVKIHRKRRHRWLPRFHGVRTLLFVLAGTSPTAAETPAFSTAEGFGRMATGGRGGTVRVVTNLDDRGPGSLRAAVEAPGPRIVVFRVGGTIRLESPLEVRNGDLTLAGQSAPGGGICLRDYGLVVRADNVIVRHLRVRPGDRSGEEVDSIWVRGGRDVILDHCSASWSVDENVSASEAPDRVTVQWCLIAEALDDSVHSKGPHSMGSLINGSRGSRISFHHNLYAHHESRCPRPGNVLHHTDDPDGLLLDFRNNVVYNWGGSDPAGANFDTDSVSRYNFAGNTYRSGPDSEQSFEIILDPPSIRFDYWAFKEHSPHAVAHFADNAMDGDRFDWENVLLDDAVSRSSFQRRTPFPTPGGELAAESPESAYMAVLADAGAHPRDAVDRRVIHEVMTRGGGIIDSQDEVGGWPVLEPGTPPADADRDGMPDDWEMNRGLDPGSPADAADDRDGDGFTNVEEYLNGLADGPLLYTVAVTSEGPGATTPSGAVTVEADASLGITLSPAPLWRVGRVAVDGMPAEVDAVQPLGPVTSDRTVHVVFDPEVTERFGTPLPWLASHGFRNFAVDELLDPDRDHLATWQEYRLRSDPRDGTSGASLEPVRLPDGDFGVRFRRPVPAEGGGVAITPEQTDDLVDWHPAPVALVGAPIPNGDGTETITFRLLELPEPPARAHVRLRFDFDTP